MAAVDRISDLSEPILHHILSFLSHKQAIQTSALSKTWRRVGPTRPKIEFREHLFKKSGDASFLSVLAKTLQRYNHLNLPVDEFILDMSSSNDYLVGIVLGKSFFKGLKKLSLNDVHIKDETTLEKIMRSCPSIEYLHLSRCVELITIPLTIFQSEFLSELHLIGCGFSPERRLRGPTLIVPTDQLLLIKRLKTLSLNMVYITEETFEKIMCCCPLIESLLLFTCVGLTKIQLIKNNYNNLKHFSASFYGVNTQSFEIHSPTIQTIRIEDCPNWYGHDKYSFPRLKTLYLKKVNLSPEFFESFSSNFPSLEKLQLEYCYGFEEIKLTVSSIKRLVLIVDSIKPIRATIYAPNIHYFEFSGRYPPKLIFYSGTTREWKSHVNIWDSNWSDNKDLNLPWLLELSELLNSLRESQILSLDVPSDPFKNLKVEDAVFCKPVPVERVYVKGGYDSCSFPDLLNGLFLICRPRCIVMNLFSITKASDLKKEKVKLVEFITYKTILNKGEMSRGYLWERDLDEISMQVSDKNSNGWHTVSVEGTSFPGFTAIYPEIRFLVKWRD